MTRPWTCGIWPDSYLFAGTTLYPQSGAVGPATAASQTCYEYTEKTRLFQAKYADADMLTITTGFGDLPAVTHRADLSCGNHRDSSKKTVTFQSNAGTNM